MKMLEEDFNQLLDEYVEDTDIVITNVRGFWELAPRTKCLLMNIGTHILLKGEELVSLKDKLQNISEEDKFHIIQEFCADMNISDSNLIKTIIEKYEFETKTRDFKSNTLLEYDLETNFSGYPFENIAYDLADEITEYFIKNEFTRFHKNKKYKLVLNLEEY